MGSIAIPLPFGPTFALELSDNFTGLVGGDVGSTATFVRYFQRRGLAVSVAVTATLMTDVAGTITQAILVGTAYLVSRDAFKIPSSPSGGVGGGSSSRTRWRRGPGPPRAGRVAAEAVAHEPLAPCGLVE